MSNTRKTQAIRCKATMRNELLQNKLNIAFLKKFKISTICCDKVFMIRNLALPIGSVIFRILEILTIVIITVWKNLSSSMQVLSGLSFLGIVEIVFTLLFFRKIRNVVNADADEPLSVLEGPRAEIFEPGIRKIPSGAFWGFAVTAIVSVLYFVYDYLHLAIFSIACVFVTRFALLHENRDLRRAEKRA